MQRIFDVYDCGRRDYAPMHALQERLLEARIADEIADTLLIVEHPPVITLGRSAKAEHLRVSQAYLAQQGIELVEIGRGGDITYHGPGQLVCYPIFDLKPDRQDVRRYVRDLEEVMIRTAGVFGIEAQRIQGLNGAWVEARKIGAVGVRIRHWVTMHGFALNVHTDLQAFDAIVPCGIHDKSVTSLSAELGADASPSFAEVMQACVQQVAHCFAAKPRWSSVAELVDA